LIRIDNLTLARGNKLLLEHATVILNPGEHIGLIGINGSGKSTFMAMLRGELAADGGECDFPANWRIAHVAQETPASPRSAQDYVIDGDTKLRQIEAQIAQAEEEDDGYAQAQAHTAYADADGYSATARAASLLLGLGFSVAQLEQPVSSFSGGWRMRLNLAQALMCPSDLLLLDEPTNHLDLDAIVWLEDWLSLYPGTLIVISHDREFLDSICNITLHLHSRQLVRYRGNYSSFEEQLAQRLVLQQSAYSKQQEQIAHLQKFVDRFKAQATKARQAQSRVKALEKIQRLAPVRTASTFTFSFPTPHAAPNPMMVIEAADCGYQHAILHDLNFSIQSGQRIGLLGANGQGKSTLIKSLVGELALLAGKRLSGKGLQIGYFAQHQLETLRADDTPLQHLARLAPEAREQALRDFLGSFNFGNTHVNAPIGPLSGGEKARLALAAIVWKKPNLLLLDEPTNHLDMETREALTLALAEFEGTLIVVSHDRHLLRATTDQFWLIHQGKVESYDGDLDDYRDWMLKQINLRRTENKTKKTNTTAAQLLTNTKKISPTKQPQRKTLQSKIDKLENQLKQLTAEKDKVELALTNTALYLPEKKNQLATLLAQQTQLNSEIETTESMWIAHQEQLDAM